MTDISSPPPPSASLVSIEDEMRKSYLDYAMSVIVARALPDARDGLKPVHRRILFAMKEAGYDAGKPYRKAARIVGDVMGKYHPHGDSAIYDAMVRMAQDFSMRLPLIDGQGNYGSMDGDPPAAMRYTEARLDGAAHALLNDIERNTVDFQDNYDNSSREPVVLPAEFPNLLVNGGSGIAVGMATNIPPHNLGETIRACRAYIDDPDISLEALMEIVPGPDFPTGGLIIGGGGVKAAYGSGRGSVIVRARTTMETVGKDRQAIIVNEIPYQVNKSRLMERLAEAARDKIVDGLHALRDESDRDGVRIVIELKRDANADVTLNQLFKFTPLQTSFGVNLLALDKGKPHMFTLKTAIAAFVEFRQDVIARRTAYTLSKARERAHVLIGLAIAVANLDAVIALIRQAKNPGAAREALVAKGWPVGDVAPLVALIDEPGRGVDAEGNYTLSEEQAKAILDLRLHRLTGLEREKIAEELKDVGARIADYLDILGSRQRLMGILGDELSALSETFATPRRSDIIYDALDTDDEDLIPSEDMVVTVSHAGYVKRVPVSAYRAQKRGGKGRAGMATREEDFVARVFVVNTHTTVLFFSSHGMVYKRKVYKLPVATPQARGKPMVQILPLQEGETITTLTPLPDDPETWAKSSLVLATASGNIRRNALDDFTQIKANGKIAMKLKDGDCLIGVSVCDESHDLLLSARAGKCIRFPVSALRIFAGRQSVGVRAMTLAADDRVISMSVLRHAEFGVEERDTYLRRGAKRGDGDDASPSLDASRHGELASLEDFILTISEKGYGKRTSAYEYRVAGRGGRGIANMTLGPRNGLSVAAAFPVSTQDQIVLVTDGGKLIRCPVADISITGRASQGVRLFDVAEDEKVVSVTRLPETPDADETPDTDENPDTQETPDAGETAGPDSTPAPDSDPGPDSDPVSDA